MATLFSKRLVELVWNQPELLLSSGFSNKTRIKSIQAINNAGAGTVTWVNGAAANALTKLETGKSYRFDVLGIVASNSSTFFTFDNGVLANSNPPAPTLTTTSGDVIAGSACTIVGTDLATTAYILVGSIYVTPVTNSVTSTSFSILLPSSLTGSVRVIAITNGGYSNALQIAPTTVPVTPGAPLPTNLTAVARLISYDVVPVNTTLEMAFEDESSNGLLQVDDKGKVSGFGTTLFEYFEQVGPMSLTFGGLPTTTTTSGRTSFTLPGASPGTLYMRVAGTTDLVSVEVGAVAGTQLGTPALSAEVNSATQITLSWTASANAPAGTVYVLQAANDAAYTNVTTIHTGTDYTYQDSSLTPNTTYYYRLLAQASGYQPSAYATVSKKTATAPVVSNPLAEALISNGQLTDSTQQSAVRAFYPKGVADGWLSKMKACYLPIGGTALAHSLNIKDPSLSNAFRLTFPNGATHDATGIRWDGQSQYGETHMPASELLAQDHTIVFGTPTDVNGELSSEYGCITNATLNDGNTGTTSITIGLLSSFNPYDSTQIIADDYLGASSNFTDINGNQLPKTSKGFTCYTAIPADANSSVPPYTNNNTGSRVLYKNKSLLYQSVGGSQKPPTFGPETFKLACRAPSSVQSNKTTRVAAFFSPGLTQTELFSFLDAVNTLDSTLNRLIS